MNLPPALPVPSTACFRLTCYLQSERAYLFQVGPSEKALASQSVAHYGEWVAANKSGSMTQFRDRAMKSLVALLLVAVLVALSAAGPAPAAPARRLTPLASVLKEAGKDPNLALRTAPGKVPLSRGAARAYGCYEPGCNYQCQSYGYPGGLCQQGTCYCWY